MLEDLGRLPLAFCAIAVFSAGATGIAAQRTWIVDFYNGAGADFTDLPPAVAAASPRDFIRVRRGVYSGFATDKPLKILGSGAGVGQISVAGLNAGESFVMSGLFGPASLRLINNSGRVHIQNWSESTASPFNLGEIRDCHLVSFTGCALRNGLMCLNSTVVLANSTVEGFGGVGTPTISTPGLRIAGSRVYISMSAVRGHDSYPPCRYCQQDTTATPGIVSTRSTVHLGRGSSVVGGTASPRQAGGIASNPGIVADNTELFLDPEAYIVGSLGAPAIASDRPPVFGHRPGLAASGAPPGGRIDVTVSSLAGSVVAVAASRPGLPIYPTPLGDIALDPYSAVLIGLGICDNSGTWMTFITVPPDPTIAASPFAIQGMASMPDARLSLPAFVVLW